MLERMLSAGIDGAISAILLAIIVVPIYVICAKLKQKFNKKHQVKESDYEEYENAFLEKLKKENEEYEKNKHR